MKPWRAQLWEVTDGHLPRRPEDVWTGRKPDLRFPTVLGCVECL